jgi:SNF2 family DNA or RNA helicase
VTGSEKERLAALHKTADIYVINRENVTWIVEHYAKKWPFDMIVLDEASSFKSASSQRFKALRKTIPFTNRLVELTGTPSPNGLLDVWSQMYLIDSGERLGRSMTAYKQRFFETDYSGYKFKPVKSADKIIHKLIDDIVISLNVDDYLEMPDRIDTVIRVSLPPSRMVEYKQLEREFLIQINDNEIVAYNAATLAGRLLQMCNGAIYTDELKNWTEIHSAKLDAIDDIISENSDENLLIAYNYKTDLIRLQARYPDAVVLDNDPDIITRWNNGQIKMLLAHPASTAHGLNLQHGGSIIVWYEPFEATRNKELAERLPEMREFLESVNNRIYDLMDIFAHQHYVDKGFLGKSSIKNVLPIIEPSLSYKELDVQNGGSASEMWNRLHTEELSESERSRIASSLKEYCGLDAYAMYAIWRVLYKLVN